MSNVEVRNYTDMRLAHLHNKFWTPNTVEVPNTGVVLNEDFVEINSVLIIQEQIQHFKVFWAIKDISGTICVPGQWNYCYIDGKFFHLTKGDSNGFIAGVEEEWFYYNVTYDDWQNDWMKNRVYLKGTLDLTGDQELVKLNIHQIPPMLENVNGRRFLDGIRKTEDLTTAKTTRLILPETLSDPLKARTQFTVWERLEFNKHLEEWHAKIKADPKLAEPVDDRLVIPLLYRMTRSGNWKNAIIKAVKYHGDRGLVVYDVISGSEGERNPQAARFRNLLQNLLHTDTLYAVASRSNRTYVHARAVNPSLFVHEVDLSGCTDITILDNLTLSKRYTLDNPAPKFNLDKFVDWIVRRQEWNHSLKDRMKTIFQEEFVKTFGKILSSGGHEDNKVFRDVTMEKIDRDVVHKSPYEDIPDELNPEWVTWADSRLFEEHKHKNFIWDHANEVRIIDGYIGFTKTYPKLTDEEKNRLKAIYRKWFEDRQNPNPNSSGFPAALTTGSVGESLYYSNFIYLPDKYKMVSNDDNTDFLDFSYNYNDRDQEWLAVTPDYDRRTHVISFLNRDFAPDSKYWGAFYYNQKNSRHRNRKNENGNPVPILPMIFREIVSVDETDVVIDWQKPSTEFLKVYKNLGKNNEHRKNADGSFDYKYRTQPTQLRDAGAEILSRGYAFMALQCDVNDSSSLYRISHESWSSTKQDPDDYTQRDTVLAQRPECVYTSEKRDWRRFHTEMTFPVKSDNFNILDKLREFDDIPDNFLRWEVINTNVKKGQIKAYVRSYVGAPKYDSKGNFVGRDNNKPGAYRLVKEEEAKIPKNSMVSIYICLRQSGSPSQDAELDKKAADEYQTKYRRSWETRMNELLYWLCRYFFLTKWETEGEYGAIPDWIKVYGAPNYPPNGDGRSQIGLSWMKPHQGQWYVAWTRFFAPPIQNSKPLRVMNNSGKLFPMVHNGNPSNDFIMGLIPNSYNNSGNYAPAYAYRKHTSQVDMNTLLAFYYGNFTPRNRQESDGFTYHTTIAQAIPKKGNTTNEVNKLPRYPTLVDSSAPTTAPHYLFVKIYWLGSFSKAQWFRWLPYEVALYEWRQYLLDWNTLILENYIRNARTYKSRRLENPKEIPNTFKDPNSIQTFTSFEDEIPPFMVHYLDPEDKLSNLATWVKNPTVKTDDERIQLYKEKLESLFRACLEMMESWGVFMKFEGTNWYANMQLNAKDMVWDFELFCDEPQQFKTRGHEKWNFINHKEDDIDVIINTRNELSTYGTSFNFKSRWYTQEDEVDLGLYIKPILDTKQTIAAQWYSISMRYNEQDVIEEIIETPKELTAYTGVSYFDKERMVRELGMQNAEYMYKKQMIEYQKSENKINDQYEKDLQWYQWKYGVIEGSMGILIGLGDAAIGAVEAITSFASIKVPQTYKGSFSNATSTEWYGEAESWHTSPYTRWKESLARPYTETWDVQYHEPGNWKEKKFHAQMGSPDWFTNRKLGFWTIKGASTFAKGLNTVAQSGMNIGRSYDLWYAKDPRRREMFNLTNQKLMLEGNILNTRHEHSRASLLREIWEASANVAFPQLNSALVYKEHNKERNLNDVHIVQYYPRGKLAEYLKQYYKEFGYQLLIRDFECTGIDSIKTHLRYQFVYENNYNDITIKSMIGVRAMNGIKVIPWVQ